MLISDNTIIFVNKLENFKVSCWGFEKPEEVDRLIGLDIDGVTVDWADKI